MGRKNKTYQKDLHQQAYERLTGMQSFGESKKAAMAKGHTGGKLFSISTYKTYWKHSKHFIKYLKEIHPEVTTLKSARRYVNEYLQKRADYVDKDGMHLSAWTIQTETASLNKLFGITKDDPSRFTPPKRERKDIKRSRTEAARDRHFSPTNNAELIAFCRGTGLRRAGVRSVRGKDLITRDRIEAEINRLYKIPSSVRTPQETTRLKICLDTRIFSSDQVYFVHIREKGGRERLAPIVGPDTDGIVRRFRETGPDEKVWGHVSSNADIHSYRADYAARVYKQYARPIDSIPYDRVNRGSGWSYQSGVYHCRKDEAGRKLDREAMLRCSKALGHNRIEVVANNYLRGI